MVEKEYIDRGASLEIVLRTGGDYATAFVEIARLPAADVVEVVHAEWIPHEHVSRSPYARNYDCSACGNCGVRMDGGNDG